MADTTYLYPPAASGGSSSNPSTGLTGLAAPTSATEIGGVNAGSGNLVAVAVDTSGNVGTNVQAFPSDVSASTQTITVVDSGTSGISGSYGQQLITGTPTAGSAATFAIGSIETGQVEVTGVFSGTISFEISVDGGTTYVSHAIHQIASPLFPASVTAPVIGSLNLAGKTHFRARATAAMTGTATVLLRTSVNNTSVYVANAVKVVDGTTAANPPQLAIKPSSTAPALSDPSVVVSISPNTPTLPVSLSSTPLPSLAATSTLQSSTQGSVAAGTAATASTAVGGVYNSTLPTLINTQQAAVQVDSSGRVLVSQPTASALNATVAQGTAANLLAQVSQPTAASLNATVVQGTAANLNATVAQPTAASLNCTDATGVAIQGTVAAGTAATKSALTGVVYNSTPVSLTNGQQVAKQADANGNLQVVQQDLMFTGQSAQTALINNIIPATAGANATNAQGFRSATIQINSTGTAGGYIFEGSNDNSNFFALTVYNAAVLTGTPINAAVVPSAANLLYIFPITTQYIRVRISTAVTGGSIQAYTRLSQAPWVQPVRQVAQATAANLNVTAAIAATQTLSTVTTVGAVTGITNALPAGTNSIGLVGTTGSAGVANAPVYNAYGTTSVTTSAYTQLIASTTAATNFVDIFDSSGQAMILATGGSGSEVILAYVPPGGDQIRVKIPISTRVAYKALTATASTGYLLMNLWQ